MEHLEIDFFRRDVTPESIIIYHIAGFISDKGRLCRVILLVKYQSLKKRLTRHGSQRTTGPDLSIPVPG